ncbi:hypothetical protein [Devosia sp.]|uniref:hypothetical protein n=1 Tax=Devosia sp. TaxID=1871048 RepID=UPI0025E5E39D|nr:hypothetical protein [Devosia sp.]MCR6634249.1 hypothetical protein [Devosia sp.]
MVLDENTLVSRTPRSERTQGRDDGAPPPLSRRHISPPALLSLPVHLSFPRLFLDRETIVAIFAAPMSCVVLASTFSLSETSAYVGVGGDVGHRVAGGQQPIENIETIIAVVDDNNALTWKMPRSSSESSGRVWLGLASVR